MPRQPRYKLVALDIDGTLLNSVQQITPELKDTLLRLGRLGVHSVLCTGRRWQSAFPVLQELEHVHSVVICSGGALIKRADDQQTLHRAPMAHADARATVDAYRTAGLVPILLFDRRIGERELRVCGVDRERAEAMPYLMANPDSCDYYPGAYPDGDERPLMVYTVDERPLIDAAEAPVREAVGARGIVEVMGQLRYGADQIAIEVHDPAATKWRALQWLMSQWDIGADEVVAVGDDVNDIPMLRGAGLSFAMGNGPAEVKAAADEVTAGNDEHGVVLALSGVFEL